MKLHRKSLLIEPPTMAAPDIAFILIVFFLVCASVQPDTGRAQTIPRTEEQQPDQPQSKTVEVSITRGAVVINGAMVDPDKVAEKVANLLRGLKKPDDRIVVVKSSADTPYERWVAVTADIELAGGIITLQMEENQTVTVD